MFAPKKPAEPPAAIPKALIAPGPIADIAVTATTPKIEPYKAALIF